MDSKQTVLIIEDELNIRHLMEKVLSDSGFITVAVPSAETALKKLSSMKPSLILLDIQLPGMNGFDFCKKIRGEPQTKEIPIIFLSAQSSEVYKIAGLESGGDDYVAKPFSAGELISRVKAVLRRTQKYESEENNLVKDDIFYLDLKSHEAILDKKKLDLTPKEFELLTLFVRSEGKVLSRDILSTQIWEREHLETSRTIDMHVARLRKKLGKFDKSIQTVGKIGYRYSKNI